MLGRQKTRKIRLSKTQSCRKPSHENPQQPAGLFRCHFRRESDATCNQQSTDHHCATKTPQARFFWNQIGAAWLGKAYCIPYIHIMFIFVYIGGPFVIHMILIPWDWSIVQECLASVAGELPNLVVEYARQVRWGISRGTSRVSKFV